MTNLPQDFSDHTRAHRNPGVRLLFVALGTVFVALGVLGAFLPVLPTTPFLLLAAACYARGSVRFYNALLNNKSFGPLILEWRRHRSMPFRIKITAITLMSVTMTASILMLSGRAWLQVMLAAMGIALAVYLWRIPSRDRPRR
jgi:uncharacterized membrane protein YbaN (DUF454 family)